MADGCHIEEIGELRSFRNGLIDFDEIWTGDAYWPWGASWRLRLNDPWARRCGLFRNYFDHCCNCGEQRTVDRGGMRGKEIMIRRD